MYDDEEEEEEIVIPQQIVIEEYDDDTDEEDEDGQADDTFTKKGTDDRAFVDQQAKDYDEMKKRKRDEIVRLKQARLNAQAKLSKKQRELTALEIQIRKSEYIDTRERVAGAREEAEHHGDVTRADRADVEIDEIKKENKDDAEELKHNQLLSEVKALRDVDTEAARKISLLEHDLLRS